MAYVQSGYGAFNPSASQDVILGITVALGDLLVVGYRGNTLTPGISDNLGNTYTLIPGADPSNPFVMWRCIVTTGGSCTVTVTQPSGRIGVAVHHYSSMDASPLDQTTDTNSGTATTSATDAFTTTTANQAIVAMWGGSVAPTPEADYGGANLQGNGTGRLYTCHRLVTSILTGEAVDWTHSSVAFQCRAATFKESAATAYTLDAEAGAVAIAGTAAALLTGRRLTSEAGSYAVTGTAAGLARGLRLDATAGAVGIAGTAAVLHYSGTDVTLDAEPGIVAITGTAATLAYGRRLEALSGAVVVTGTPAAFVATRRLVADAGAFVLVGTAADLRTGIAVVELPVAEIVMAPDVVEIIMRADVTEIIMAADPEPEP